MGAFRPKGPRARSWIGKINHPAAVCGRRSHRRCPRHKQVGGNATVDCIVFEEMRGSTRPVKKPGAELRTVQDKVFEKGQGKFPCPFLLKSMGQSLRSVAQTGHPKCSCTRENGPALKDNGKEERCSCDERRPCRVPAHQRADVVGLEYRDSLEHPKTFSRLSRSKRL